MKKIFCLIIALSMILSMTAFNLSYAADAPVFEDSFENGIDNWDYWSKDASKTDKVSDEGYSHGSKSYFVNDTDETLSMGLKSKEIPAVPGETYTLTCDVFSTLGSMPIYFRFFDADGKTLETAQTAVKVTKKWETIKLTKVAPENTHHIKVLLCTNIKTKHVGYYDNVKVFTGDVKADIPSSVKTPPIPEGPKVEVVPDNYKDGEVILSESFEGTEFPEGWKKQGNVVVNISSDVAKDGKSSLYIEDKSDTGAGGIASPFIPVTPGNKYTAVVDIYAIENSVPVFFKFFDADKKQLTNVSTTKGEHKTWTTVTNSQTAPAGAAYASIYLNTVKASLQTGYVDNFKFVKGIYIAPKVEHPYIAPKQVQPVPATLVAPVGDKLVYNTYNEQGDTIGDFSYAGFYMGECELPDVTKLPVAMELSPTGAADDTSMLQSAIDKVYNESPDDSMKVIKLKAGTYNINKSGIRLKSGIVLLGEGQGPTGTILYAKDPVQYIPVRISGSAPVVKGERANITDDYIKAGTKTINLSAEDIKNFKVGDHITVYNPTTVELSKAIGMDKILNVYDDDTSWKGGDFDSKSERIITAINGTEITLNYSLFLPADKKYIQSYIYKTDDSGKIKNAGLDNLRIVSYYNGDPNDEQHATTAISISNAKNIFVRNVSAKHFYMSLVSSAANAKQISVVGCSSLDPVSTVAGSRRYSFAASTSAEQVLYTGNYSYDGRHDFETSLSVTGPIAYVDNVVDSSNTASETHGTWSTGVLYDNLFHINNGSKGFIALANRGIYGTAKSQGWSAASSLVWNSLASTIVAHDVPDTYQNFLVGAWGIYEDPASVNMKTSNVNSYKKIYRTTEFYNAKDSHFETKEGTPFVGDSYKEAEFTPVEPRSLYKAQLAERITGSIKNARPNAPVIVYPKSDKKTDVKEVKISGLYQLGATAVTIYVDDVAYNATLKPETNEFEYTILLNEGVHKIYATQTIGGVEGVKNADRFITVGKENGNPEYLQSIYPSSKTTLLINDPRPTYDEYEKKLLATAEPKVTVFVNNLQLESDVDPFIENGRTLVPMRAIFEAIGAEVTWDAATETATSKKDETEVKITKNNTTAYVNGAPVTLDVPAMIKDGRFVVPVRFISESFGCEVGWNDVRKIVTIRAVGLRFPAPHGLSGELDIYDLIQSGDDGAGSIIDNTVDNTVSTSWGVAYDESKPDGAYGIIDLGSKKNISELYLMFHQGDKRVYTFDLYVGDDKDNMTLVSKDVKSSGATTDFETFRVDATGRYLKIVGKGNSVNYWLNIKELAVIGK